VTNASARVLEVIRGVKSLFGLEGMAFGEVSLMRSAPLQDWVILAAACAAFIALDWAVLQRLPHTFGWDLAQLGFWVVVAVAFNTLVGIRFGPKDAAHWAMGYVIEWMLSLDNLMLIQMMFVVLRTPPIQVRKAVCICMYCSVFTCMGLYVLVAEMFSHFSWIRYPLAASLIWGGIQAAISSDDIAPEDLCVIRGLRWLLGDRLAGSYSADGSVFTRDEPRGKAQATLLLVAIVMAGWIDTIFSLDSVAIKVSIIENGYVAYSSSVLAIFVLKAMFFVIASLVQMFDLLRYGLCIILIFVGVQMIVSPWVKITPVSMFIVMVAVFIVSIVASVIKNQGKALDSGQPQEAPQEVLGNGQPQDEPVSGQPQEAY
jgi:tellurite resistance protein TerC